MDSQSDTKNVVTITMLYLARRDQQNFGKARRSFGEAASCILQTARALARDPVTGKEFVKSWQDIQNETKPYQKTAEDRLITYQMAIQTMCLRDDNIGTDARIIIGLRAPTAEKRDALCASDFKSKSYSQTAKNVATYALGILFNEEKFYGKASMNLIYAGRARKLPTVNQL